MLGSCWIGRWIITKGSRSFGTEFQGNELSTSAEGPNERLIAQEEGDKGRSLKASRIICRLGSGIKSPLESDTANRNRLEKRPLVDVLGGRHTPRGRKLLG